MTENFIYGIEVNLKNPDDFLKVKETLTRIGLATKPDPDNPNAKRSLIQSCHILHKRGKYYILHFKEMFSLDGLDSTLTTEDVKRRDAIATLLAEWNLVQIADPNAIGPKTSIPNIKVIPFSEKDNWNLVYKHKVGNRKK